MTDLRLTFASEGLAAVSQILVEMGLSFSVEPVGAVAKEEKTAPAAAAPPTTSRRPPAKTARKSPAKTKRAAQSERGPSDAPAAGAERLRAAIAQSGTAYRSLIDPGAGAATPGASADETAGRERNDE